MLSHKMIRGCNKNVYIPCYSPTDVTKFYWEGYKQMIGILCGNKNKIKYTKKIYKLINIDNSCKTEPVIIFSISDLDLKSKTVSGNLIKRNEIISVTTSIPEIINNFLIPQKRSSRKKIRMLSEQPDVFLVNEANRFRQNMIMEMLSSSVKTKDLIPKYLLSSKKWFVLDVPDMLEQNGRPVIYKLYTVRDGRNKWNVLPLPGPAPEYWIGDEFTRTLYKSALEVARCIGNFIPSLAFCTVYFVSDKNRSLFLANFTGWDSSLLLKMQKPILPKLFARCFFEYNNMLLNLKRGEK